jgi:hypothetical protein
MVTGVGAAFMVGILRWFGGALLAPIEIETRRQGAGQSIGLGPAELDFDITVRLPGHGEEQSAADYSHADPAHLLGIGIPDREGVHLPVLLRH